MGKDCPVGVQAIHSNCSTLLKVRIGHMVAEKGKKMKEARSSMIWVNLVTDKSTGVPSHGNAVLLA